MAQTNTRRGPRTAGEAVFGLLLAFALVTTSSGSRQDQSVALNKVFPALGIQEGLTVCEIGAGAGDLTFAAARLVGSKGRVFANELGDNVVKLRDRVTAAHLPQITVVAGSVTQTNFPPGVCDAVFMNDVYHHFSNPSAMNTSIVASMKPGSRLGIIDFTPPGAEAPQPSERGNDGMHGITAETLGRELRAAGLDLVSSEVIHRVVVVIAARLRVAG